MRLSTVALILTLTIGLFFAPLATNAQQAGKVARIGWLLPFRSECLRASDARAGLG
jgi:hypothetical protein